jgi:hypothetical protein
MIVVRSYTQLGVRDAISALETVISYILAQENVNDDIFIVYVVLKTYVLHVKRIV